MRRSWSSLGQLRREHPHLLGGSAWLLAGTLVLSVGSFIFWMLVARELPADDVGRATALFGATWFVCYLTSLGLPIAIGRYASDRTRDSSVFFAWSLLLAVLASLLGVVAFAAVAPGSIREGLASWPTGLAWAVVFLLVAGLAISILVDIRLMALRRWSLVFWRAVLVAVTRLPFLLWVPEGAVALYVYVVAMGGFAVTGVAFLLPLAHRGWLRLRPLPARAGQAAQFAGVNFVAQLVVQAPFFAVPFVVLAHVGAVENARFYLSWGVMAVVYICIQVISQALLVEGGRDGADHRRQAAVAMGVGLALAASSTVLSLAVAPLLADVYGSDYGPVATLLPLLMAGTIPFSVTMAMLTTARIREHASTTLAVSSALAIAVLIPTTLLVASDGALGAAWGWMIGNAIAAVLAVVASRLPKGRAVGEVESVSPSTMGPVAELSPVSRPDQATLPRSER